MKVIGLFKDPGAESNTTGAKPLSVITPIQTITRYEPEDGVFVTRFLLKKVDPNKTIFVYIHPKLVEKMDDIFKYNNEASMKLGSLISYKFIDDIIQYLQRHHIRMSGDSQGTIGGDKGGSQIRSITEIGREISALNNTRAGGCWTAHISNPSVRTYLPFKMSSEEIEKALEDLIWLEQESERLNFITYLETHSLPPNFPSQRTEFWETTKFTEGEVMAVESWIEAIVRQLKQPTFRVPRTPQIALFCEGSGAGKTAFLDGITSPIPNYLTAEIPAHLLTDDWAIKTISRILAIKINEIDAIKLDGAAPRLKAMISGDGRLLLRKMKSQLGVRATMFSNFAMTSNVPIHRIKWIQGGQLSTDHMMPIPVKADLRKALNLDFVKFHHKRFRLEDGVNVYDCGSFFKNLYVYINQTVVQKLTSEADACQLMRKQNSNLRLKSMTVLIKHSIFENYVSDVCRGLGYKLGEVIKEEHNQGNNQEVELEWLSIKDLKERSGIDFITNTSIANSALVRNQEAFLKNQKSPDNYIRKFRLGTKNGYRLMRAYLVGVPQRTISTDDLLQEAQHTKSFNECDGVDENGCHNKATWRITLNEKVKNSCGEHFGFWNKAGAECEALE